jgi:hypothetical protein
MLGDKKEKNNSSPLLSSGGDILSITIRQYSAHESITV